MLLRPLAIWLLMMLLAIANGAFREAVLVPRLGPARAHVASTAMLCLLIALLAGLSIRWIAPGSARAAWLVGALWLGATLAFELGFGRFVAGKSWSELAADYDLLAGRVWIFVPITVFSSPYIAARLRGALAS